MGAGDGRGMVAGRVSRLIAIFLREIHDLTPGLIEILYSRPPFFGLTRFCRLTDTGITFRGSVVLKQRATVFCWLNAAPLRTTLPPES